MIASIRMSALALALLLASPALAGATKQSPEEAAETIAEDTIDSGEAAVEAQEMRAEDALEELAEETEETALDLLDEEDDAEGDEDEESVPAPAPPGDSTAYRYQTLDEQLAIDALSGFNHGALLDCRDGVDDDDIGRRERMVTNHVPYTLFVLDDGTLTARYEGGDDPDGEIQECMLEEIGDMDLEPVPAELTQTRAGLHIYDDNYYDRRRQRHAEIIALYTLSGVAGGVAIGSFVAARADDRELENRDTFTASGPGRARLEDRPDRFRAAGWSMVGVSVVSFVAGTMLHTRNREIESNENPVLVFSPGSPTGDLGFTFSSRF